MNGEIPGNSGNEEAFNKRAAMGIAVMAMILAIAGLGGNNATEDALHFNIKANDTWNFFQAKTIRQTAYSLAANDLEWELQAAETPEGREKLQSLLQDYRAVIDRYESEPDPNDPSKGEGRRELIGIARGHEAARANAVRMDQNFDIAETFLQIAIVMGSVSILASVRWLLGFGVLLALAGTVFTANGYLLFF